jgi:hypothetical protein
MGIIYGDRLKKLCFFIPSPKQPIGPKGLMAASRHWPSAFCRLYPSKVKPLSAAIVLAIRPEGLIGAELYGLLYRSIIHWTSL